MIFQAAWDKRKQYKRADRYFWTKFQAAIPIKVYGFESRLKLEKFIFQASIPQYKLLEVLASFVSPVYTSNFYVTIICSCRWTKLTNICMTIIFAEKLAC